MKAPLLIIVSLIPSYADWLLSDEELEHGINARIVSRKHNLPTEVEKWSAEGGQYGLFLLFCEGSCTQLQYWIQSYRNSSLAFNHSKFRLVDNYDIAETLLTQHGMEVGSFPALLYKVADRVFVYQGRLDLQSEIEKWMGSFEAVGPFYIDSEAFQSMIDETDRGIKWIVYMQNSDNKNCGSSKKPVQLWKSLAQSLSDVPNFKMGILDAKEENEIPMITLLENRMPDLGLYERCPQIVPFQESFYTSYEPTLTASKKLEAVRNWMREISINSSHDYSWWPVREPLSDIETLYWTMEWQNRRLRSNPSYLMVGISGGVGVIVLAVSIFWGLKTSSFTTPEQHFEQ